MMTISFTCSTAHLLTSLAALRRSACPSSATDRRPSQRISGSGIGVRESVVPSPARHGVTMIGPEIRRKCMASQARSAGRRVGCSPHEPVWTKVHTTRATCHERSPGFSVDRDGYPMPIVTQCVRCSTLDSTCRGGRFQAPDQRPEVLADGGRLEVCFAESLIGSRGAVLVRGAGEQADRAGDGCQPGPHLRGECEVCGVKCEVTD